MTELFNGYITEHKSEDCHIRKVCYREVHRVPRESERVMNVDINNLRVQTVHAYNRLFNKFCELKDGIDNNNKKDAWSRKDNLKDEIENMVNQFLELKQYLGGICSVYTDNGMEDVSVKVTIMPTQKWLSQYDPESWGEEE